MGAIVGSRVVKCNLGTRAGKCKVSVRVVKHKLGARAAKYKFGPGLVNKNMRPGPGAKQRARDREIEILCYEHVLLFLERSRDKRN